MKLGKLIILIGLILIGFQAQAAICPDADSDGIPDPGCFSVKCTGGDTTDCDDNCWTISNPDQADLDGDFDGDVCDDDVDDDGYPGDRDLDGTCNDGSTGTCDCDDEDDAVHPDATEVCDGIDNDCNGSIDGGDAVDATTYYEDIDGDGYGDPALDKNSCNKPGGYVEDNTDCDDTDADVNPGANELCYDETDNDCDGEVDETSAEDAPTWYIDADGDTFGSTDDTVVSCLKPEGYVSSDTDCDDDNIAVHPNATEICADEVDNNCDGEVDEDGCAGASDDTGTDPDANTGSDTDTTDDTTGGQATGGSGCSLSAGLVGQSAYGLVILLSFATSLILSIRRKR